MIVLITDNDITSFAKLAEVVAIKAIKQLIFKNKKWHVKKWNSFQHFVNISTDSKSSAIIFFKTGLIYAYIFDIKIQKSTKYPIFLMIFCAENQFFEKIITG